MIEDFFLFDKFIEGVEHKDKVLKRRMANGFGQFWKHFLFHFYKFYIITSSFVVI